MGCKIDALHAHRRVMNVCGTSADGFGRAWNEMKTRYLEEEALKELREELMRGVRQDFERTNKQNAQAFADEVGKALARVKIG